MAEVRILAKPHPTNAATVKMITRKAVATRTFAMYEPGAFSIEIPSQELRGTDVDNGDIVLINGLEYAGIIKNMRFTSGKSGDTTVLAGQDLRELLTRRRVVPTNYTTNDGTAGYDARTGTSEAIIKGLVRDNISAPPQASRPAISNFTIAPDIGRGVADDKYMSRFEKISDALTAIGTDASLGFNIAPALNNGQPFGFVFDCFTGIDRTYGQTDNAPALFEVERGNVTSMEYTDSIDGYANVFYTTRSGARFADEALTLVYYRDGEDEPSGYDRIENWLNVNVSSNVPAGDEYNELKRLAEIQMKQWERIKTFTAKVNSLNIKFGRDYAVGDIVTVRRNGWGAMLNAQITKVTVAEKRGAAPDIVVTFGHEKPDIFKRIGAVLKEMR